MNYDSGHPWQPAADGAGHSLVLARPSYGMDDPHAWDISFNLDGTPGIRPTRNSGSLPHRIYQ